MQHVDLDELFRDCDFGEVAVGLPDDVTSAIPTISVPQPLQPPPVPQLRVQTPLPPPQSQFVPSSLAPNLRRSSSRRWSALAGGMAAAIRPAAATTRGRDERTHDAGRAAAGLDKPPTHELSEVQKVDRRERNREHAKRSRLRKKVLLESLQEQIHGLNSEIKTLKEGVSRRHIVNILFFVYFVKLLYKEEWIFHVIKWCSGGLS